MRTTVRIEDDLLAELRERANGSSLTAVLNETIRRGLRVEDREGKDRRRTFRQKTYALGKPLIDVNKALSIMDEMDDIERLRKMGMLRESDGP